MPRSVMNATPDSPGAPGRPRIATPISTAEFLRIQRQCDLLRTHREHLGLSRERFANAHGLTVRDYSRKEKGARISMASLYVLQNALQMGPEASEELFTLVTGGAPSLKALAVDPALERVTARWAAAHVHTQKNPTVLMDGGWNARHFNAAWVEIFDAIEPHPTDHPLDNPMRFLLFHPLAPHLFPSWEERWLVTAVTQVAIHYTLRPEDPSLQDIRRRIHDVPLLEELYVSRAQRELAERGVDVIFEGDVSQRHVVAGTDTADILLTVLIPWHAREYGYQMMTMSPRDHGVLIPDSHPSPEAVYLRPRHPSAPKASTAPHSDGASPPNGKTTAATAPQAQSGYSEWALTVGQLLHWYRTKHVRLSQERLAREKLPVTSRTYGPWERDELLPKAEYVPQIAAALKMPDPVRRYLHTRITNSDPPIISTPVGPDIAERSALWARVHVESQPAPTATMDGAWQILVCNDAYRSLFAHVPTDPTGAHPTQSWLRYVLFHPDARETLGEWSTQWLPGTMTDLVVTLTREQGALPTEQRAFLQEIEADPVLSDAYARSIHRDPQGSATDTTTLGDGDIRTIWTPNGPNPNDTRTEQPVCVTVGVPLHGKAHGHCMLTLTPWDQDAQPHAA